MNNSFHNIFEYKKPFHALFLEQQAQVLTKNAFHECNLSAPVHFNLLPSSNQLKPHSIIEKEHWPDMG